MNELVFILLPLPGHISDLLLGCQVLEERDNFDQLSILLTVVEAGQQQKVIWLDESRVSIVLHDYGFTSTSTI